jgi:hypothetical protein
MNGWKLYIEDSLNNEKVVQNPDCLPHKGIASTWDTHPARKSSK